MRAPLAEGSPGGPTRTRTCRVCPPDVGSLPNLQPEWSPRVREWSHGVEADRVRLLVIPARAGVAPTGALRSCARSRGPYTCGGSPWARLHRSRIPLCAPRLRGPLLSVLQGLLGVVLPSRAGVVPPSGAPSGTPRRGPRACRGDPVWPLYRSGAFSWSPRVRGPGGGSLPAGTGRVGDASRLRARSMRCNDPRRRRQPGRRRQ